MKPLVEKLTLAQDTSFLAKTYRTPHFEVPWHQHIEYELILFTEGEGVSYIGNDVGEFKTDDIFFLGANLPHTFQKAQRDMVTSAVVVQFREDCWGEELMQLPESRQLKKLLQTSSKGLRVNGGSREQLRPMIKELEQMKGFRRIIRLFECLLVLADKEEYTEVSTQETQDFNAKQKERIDKIFQYTIDHFQEGIRLPNVASHAGMSIPAFCNYFKKSTKKTYVDFLNEVRIGNACRLLIDTQTNVEDICYESGFNTLANFNKQFLKIKGLTPSKYRRRFMNRTEVV